LILFSTPSISQNATVWGSVYSLLEVFVRFNSLAKMRERGDGNERRIKEVKGEEKKFEGKETGLRTRRKRWRKQGERQHR